MGGGLGSLGGFGGLANSTATPDLAANTNNPGQTRSPTDTTNTQGTTGLPPPNPLLDPGMMQQFIGAFGTQGGAGLGGGLFGTPTTPAPTDTRPPEERFQDQLQVSVPHRLTPELVNDVFNHS